MVPRRWWRAAALAATGLTICAGARADLFVPSPANDPFYAVPSGVASDPPGTVLRSRAITATLAGLLPLPVNAWQLQYATKDVGGIATATVATVLVPKQRWHGPGARPLVSLQSAEDGVGMTCAPSYALRTAAALATGSPASVDLPAELPPLLARGWAVVVPDWEGPHSEFAAAEIAAHSVLDGIRAALHFAPAGLSASSPLAMWGYSGGGFATEVAAQLQPSYAPALSLVGAAAGGVPGDIRYVYRAANGSAFGGAVTVLFIGLQRAFPSAHLDQYLNASGRQVIAGAQGTCLGSAAAANPALDLTKLMSPAGIQLFNDLQWRNSPLDLPGVPAAPLYLYHATDDELVPFASARLLAAQLCSTGARVDFAPARIAEHFSEGVLGLPGAVAFLADRFAGASPPDTCPARPPAATVRAPHRRAHARHRRHRHHPRPRRHRHHSKSRRKALR